MGLIMEDIRLFNYSIFGLFVRLSKFSLTIKEESCVNFYHLTFLLRPFFLATSHPRICITDYDSACCNDLRMFSYKK